MHGFRAARRYLHLSALSLLWAVRPGYGRTVVMGITPTSLSGGTGLSAN